MNNSKQKPYCGFLLRDITLNSLYINPRRFTQLSLGLPIEGFCVAAGIPTTEKAVKIINGLKAAGIQHVAFKPGSIDGIRQVVNIAAANPGFPIFLQVVLVSHCVGSVDDGWEYLTGDWSGTLWGATYAL